MRGQEWFSRPEARLMFITHPDSQYRLSEQVEGFLDGGGHLIQLRSKDRAESAVLRDAQRVSGLLGEDDRLVVNDFWSVAREVSAWGVHLGRGDAAPDMVRRTLGQEVVIGATAHNYEELRDAAKLPVDYIGLGPLRFTRTKRNLAPILGMEGVRKILQQARDFGIRLPVYVIGGVENQDVRELLGMGAFGVAVSGSIALATDLEFATRKYMESIHKIVR